MKSVKTVWEWKDIDIHTYKIYIRYLILVNISMTEYIQKTSVCDVYVYWGGAVGWGEHIFSTYRQNKHPHKACFLF